MNDQEALEMGIKLRLAFPKMNDEQNKMLMKTFGAYDVGDVSAAIEDHFTRFDFVNGKALVDQIDLNARKHSSTAIARLNSAKESFQGRWHEHQAAVDDIDVQHSKQDRCVADFSDDELAALKESAINDSRLDDNTKKFMRTKNPRKSRLLKSMIYDLMQKTGEVPS